MCKQMQGELKLETNTCNMIDEASPIMVQGTETPNHDSGLIASVDFVTLSCSKNDYEVPLTSSSVPVASMEGRTLLHDEALASTDFGSKTAKSKERFRQRLWCFLFENLNRDVDELYLL
jgi:hypothetical protein